MYPRLKQKEMNQNKMNKKMKYIKKDKKRQKKTERKKENRKRRRREKKQETRQQKERKKTKQSHVPTTARPLASRNVSCATVGWPTVLRTAPGPVSSLCAADAAQVTTVPTVATQWWAAMASRANVNVGSMAGSAGGAWCCNAHNAACKSVCSTNTCEKKEKRKNKYIFKRTRRNLWNPK